MSLFWSGREGLYRRFPRAESWCRVGLGWLQVRPPREPKSSFVAISYAALSTRWACCPGMAEAAARRGNQLPSVPGGYSALPDVTPQTV